MGNAAPPFDPVRFQALFENVRDQLHGLQTTWEIFLCLYGTPHGVEILQATAWVTFGALQKVLTHAIWLGTHRLLEAGSSGKKTASIQTLISSLPAASAHLRRRLQKDINLVRKDCEQLSEWRHRSVVHIDLATVLREHPTPLEPVKMRSVGNAIEVFARTLTAISDELGLNVPYDPHHETSDLDVHDLIRRLQATRNL